MIFCDSEGWIFYMLHNRLNTYKCKYKLFLGVLRAAEDILNSTSAC